MTCSLLDILSAITVSFSQVTYFINESDGRLQPMLFFSNPSSIDITLQVKDTSNTATGMSVRKGTNSVVKSYLCICVASSIPQCFSGHNYILTVFI